MFNSLREVVCGSSEFDIVEEITTFTKLEMAEVETVTTVQETVTVISETKTVSTDGVVTEEVTTVTKTTEGDSHGQEESKTEDQVEEIKENGGAEPAKEDETADVETEAVATEEQDAGKIEAAQEEKKEEGPPKVVLHQFPPGKNIPSFSPYCLKLETFLRINKIPYENVHSYKLGKKGKMPWIEYKGEKVADSNFIIDHLSKICEVDMDSDLSQSDKAQSRAFRIMLEESTCRTLAYNRWVDEANEWKRVSGASAKGIGSTVGFKMHQRKVRSALDQQGIGRHSKEEIYHIAEQDLRAISDFLGEKPYLMGSLVTRVDVTAFGILANFLYAGLEGPQLKLIKEELTNLVDYVERMKSEYWADWQEMVLGDKPEHTNIPRRFSFKRSKKKVREAKKDESSAEDDKPEKEKAEEGKTEENEEEAATEVKTEASEDKATVEEGEAKPEETPQVNGEATESEKTEAEAKSD